MSSIRAPQIQIITTLSLWCVCVSLSLSLRPGAAGASHSVRPPSDEEEEVASDPAHAAGQWHM